MDISIFSEQDLLQIHGMGQTPEKVLEQLHLIRRGVPPTRLERPCTQGDGIVALDSREMDELARDYDQAMSEGRASKFVPASGASTRMFRSLLGLLDRGLTGMAALKEAADQGGREAREGLAFLENLRKFAFREALEKAAASRGLDLEAALRRGDIRPVLECLLLPGGLDFGHTPKGLIPFHLYPDGPRTPFEEHLAEAALYVRRGDGLCRVHFTVSPDQEAGIRKHLESARRRFESQGTRFEIAYSNQKPSTDTIAADLDGFPFRDKQGRPVFRPGGHGALLENLQETGGDLVFIKNIDNVAPDALKAEGVRYKKAMGGYLLRLQRQVFARLEKLDREGPAADLEQTAAFVESHLGLALSPALKAAPAGERRRRLAEILDRPLRVCGMVKNQGEPGGGPFWVRHRDGSLSMQIVESSQVDADSGEQQAVAAKATHFNPSDLVCALRDFRGRPFDLSRYRDADAAFISRKSSEGKDLEALELPGLWNGSMAFWNTAFVEIPVEIFNPVKTVNDLLRPEHTGRIPPGA